VTHYTDYDIDFPSLGAGPEGQAGIVFQQGGKLHVLDVPSEQLHDLEVTVPDDADFVLDSASGRYKLGTVFPGDNTRDLYRSPLSVPGVDVRAGAYLLAIAAEELKAPVDPYSLLVGKQNAALRLTIADSPNGKRRDVTVEPVKTELPLREQAWIDHNREVVDKASGGKVAYIYVSDMAGRGMDQVIRRPAHGHSYLGRCPWHSWRVDAARRRLHYRARGSCLGAGFTVGHRETTVSILTSL
jgi:hypothetical protein